MNELGKKIKLRREELGLSQDELARMLGYKHKSSINKIELGAADVPRAKVPAFAKALGMTPGEFSGYSDIDEILNTKKFSYCLEKQMETRGWYIIYDSDGNVILTHEGAEYEITMSDVEALEGQMALYLDFILNKLASSSRKIGGSK